MMRKKKIFIHENDNMISYGEDGKDLRIEKAAVIFPQSQLLSHCSSTCVSVPCPVSCPPISFSFPLSLYAFPAWVGLRYLKVLCFFVFEGERDGKRSAFLQFSVAFWSLQGLRVGRFFYTDRYMQSLPMPGSHLVLRDGGAAAAAAGRKS